MSENFNKKLGLRIREIRLSKKIKQSELADKLNMERSNFTRIESGKQCPNNDNLEKIAEILGVEIKDLFDFNHKKPVENLIDEIIIKLKNHPEKIEDIYKIVSVLTN